jgi:hypothetical protein
MKTPQVGWLQFLRIRQNRLLRLSKAGVVLRLPWCLIGYADEAERLPLLHGVVARNLSGRFSTTALWPFSIVIHSLRNFYLWTACPRQSRFTIEDLFEYKAEVAAIAHRQAMQVHEKAVIDAISVAWDIHEAAKKAYLERGIVLKFDCRHGKDCQCIERLLAMAAPDGPRAH